MISLDHPEVRKWFENDGRGNWRCKQTGKVIEGDILEFYRSFGNSGLNGFTHFGLPTTGEVYPLYDKTPDKVVLQKFERAIVASDFKHQLDFPPGSGAVYLTHLTYSPKRQITSNSEHWDSEGITSSWRHILISYEAMERCKSETGAYNLDPDWWETYRNQDIQDFDAYERWQNDLWRRIGR